MAEAIGPKHGITKKQLDEQLEKLPKCIQKLRSRNKIREKEDTYRNLPYDGEIVEKVERLVARLKRRCKILVVLGIGGSALGNIALQIALNPYMYNLDATQRIGPRLFVFDNIDPQQFISFLKWLGDRRLKNTVFSVISRGGQTAETISQFLIIRQLLRRKFGHKGYQQRVVVTTTKDQDSTLYKIADKEKLEFLEIPEDIVGRFSVLSAIGLFSTAMCGIKVNEIKQLLAGAKHMNERVKKMGRGNIRKNPAAINAAINYCLYKKGKRISVMMPYSYHLKDMADWYRQLWAESLGKVKVSAGNEVHVGPTPVKALGTTDQHSQVQLYREGPNDKLFTFLQVNNFDKKLKIGPAPDSAPELAFLAGKDLSTLLSNEKKATEYALLQSKRPCLTVVFDEVNAYTVGQFIYLYEVTTSFAGALFGINPYDQPAVELGKQATFALMGKPGYYKPGYTYRRFAAKIRTRTKVNRKFLV